MRNPRTAVSALATTLVVAVGGTAFALAGAGPATSAPAVEHGGGSSAASPVGDLLAGSYRSDAGRLSGPSDTRVVVVREPMVTGQPRVGHTLSVSAGSWKPSAVSLSYRWFAGGKEISGARDSSYAPTAGVVGDSITVQVTAAKSGYRSVSVAKSVGVVKAGELRSTSRPSVRGVAQVGEQLRVVGGRWSENGVEVSYAWLSGRKVVSTDKRYTIGRRDRGKSLRVEVTASKPGFRDVSVLTGSTDTIRA